MQNQDKPAAIVRAVAGIDAAITARHHIAVREFFDDGTEHLSRFTVDPTLAGLERLSARLAAVTACQATPSQEDLDFIRAKAQGTQTAPPEHRFLDATQLGEGI
jgi:hypothetical protein